MFFSFDFWSVLCIRTKKLNVASIVVVLELATTGLQEVCELIIKQSLKIEMFKLKIKLY